jgi:aminoglycoside 3-N-acetyltransferase
MTFYHYIEEFNKVDYRYFKNFTGDYTDANGQTYKKNYRLFVRNVDKGVMTHVNPTGELLWENKIYYGSKPGEGNGLRTAYARNIFDFVTKEIINKNKAEGLLYRIEK